MSHVTRKPVCHMLKTKAQISLRGSSAQSDQHLCCSIVPLVSISEISRLHLASVAAQAGLSLTWSKTPKTGFLVTGLNYFSR